MYAYQDQLAELCSFECISFYIHNAFGCWPFGCYVYNAVIDTEINKRNQTTKQIKMKLLKQSVADIINSIKKVTFLLF